MRFRVVAAVGALLALGGCGDDRSADDEPARPCPTFAVVSDDAEEGEAYKDYIVGFELALMREPQERAALLADVSEQLCLAVTEERQLAVDAVIVDSGRPLGTDGQRALIKALTSADGVTYAEPDEVVTTDAEPGTAE